MCVCEMVSSLDATIKLYDMHFYIELEMHSKQCESLSCIDRVNALQ